MKTTKGMVFEGSFNLCAITEHGGAISTQVWQGGSRGAACRILEWYKRGARRGTLFDSPIVHAYVHSHSTKETWFIDLAQESDVMLLEGQK